MKKNNLKKMCVCAVLAALYVALELVASNLGKIAFLDNYQIPISCFPLILASVMFGLGWGTLTAVVGSFISQLGFGIGWGTIIWMAPTVLYAVCVALLYKAFKKSNKTYILSIQFFISSIILSILNTMAMYVNNYIYGIPYDLLNKLFAVIVSLKLIGAIVFAVVFAFIIPPIINKLKKIIKF